MQIISASRRCDLPAFNMPSIISKFNSEKYADCFWVLWTKNPRHIVNSGLDFKRVALQLTVTGLGGTAIEPGVPAADEVWADVEKLINKGFDRRLLNWRCDPLLGGLHSPAMISKLAERAHSLGITRCMTSFLSTYDAVKQRWPEYENHVISREKQVAAVKTMRKTLNPLGIALYGCAQPHLAGLLIPSKCIDGDYYAQITGFDFSTEKDERQRKFCGCTLSKEVGDYLPCGHGCKYCYARPAEPEKSDDQLSLL